MKGTFKNGTPPNNARLADLSAFAAVNAKAVAA